MQRDRRQHENVNATRCKYLPQDFAAVFTSPNRLVCVHRDLGSKQCLSVVDHVPGCNANGHYANFRGGAGQRVISHSLAQVFGDAKAEPISQNPRACKREKHMHINIWFVSKQVFTDNEFPLYICQYQKICSTRKTLKSSLVNVPYSAKFTLPVFYNTLSVACPLQKCPSFTFSVCSTFQKHTFLKISHDVTKGTDI